MDAITGALIGLLGGLIAALVVARQQRDSTRALIAAEFEKLTHQHLLQSKAHTRHRRDEWLLDSVPALLASSDPELHTKFNYAEVVSLIHKIQLVLVPGRPLEGAVNDAASNIGFAVRASKNGEHDAERLFGAQDSLIVATRALLDSS